MKNNISAIVVAKNEEEKIGECLDSVSWVDEILVVDSGSIDKTPDIARKKGAEVIRVLKGGFSDWRNEGAKKAKGDWLLYVDADERVTPLLRKEIRRAVSNPKGKKLFAIPRKNVILGKEMRHGGWWPDYVKRLMKKKFFKAWKGELHENPVVEGELGHLKNPLIHIKHDNLEEMVEKTNKWSEIEAKLMYQAKHPKMNAIRFISAMGREFWLRMVCHRAFLDGVKGIIYAIYQVYSKFISYAKLWEIQIQGERVKE